MKKDRPGDGPLQPVSVQTTANVARGLKDKVGVFLSRESGRLIIYYRVEGLQSGYFEPTFKRIMEKEAYNDPVKNRFFLIF